MTPSDHIMHISVDDGPDERVAEVSGALDVFSSMQVYDQPTSRDPYKTLYDQCRATEGIDYRGSVTQPELAKALREASILSYPNTFANTAVSVTSLSWEQTPIPT